ncbi:hypothetical protein [Peptoniphilus asaccharolyticus]
MVDKEKFEDVREQINSSVDGIFPSDFVKNKIDLQIRDLERERGGFIMKRMKKLKLAAALAICILVGGVGVYAIGTITGTISSSTSYYNYTKYEDIKKAEKKAGLEAVVPETIGDFKFDGITMLNMADTDDEGNQMNKRKAISVSYKDNNGEIGKLHLDKFLPNQPKIEEQPYTEKRQINGHDFYFTRLESLFLASEEEMTPEEKERSENDPFFNVGIGGEGTKRETSISHHLSFEDNGITYSFMTSEEISSEKLFEMASEFFK